MNENWNRKPHYHWTWWAFAHRHEDQLVDASLVTVVAEDYEEALAKAQRLVPIEYKGSVQTGAGYTLREVTEFNPECEESNGR